MRRGTAEFLRASLRFVNAKCAPQQLASLLKYSAEARAVEHLSVVILSFVLSSSLFRYPYFFKIFLLTSPDVDAVWSNLNLLSSCFGKICSDIKSFVNLMVG